MKLLIGGTSSKFFHLQEFSQFLDKQGIECKLVYDADFCDGFPSRNISHWFQNQNKFKNLLDDFKPDVILVDRQRHFGVEAVKTKIPLMVHLRGNFWEEMKLARQTLYKMPHKRLALKMWEKMGAQCFDGSTIILPICKYLDGIVKIHYPNKYTEILYQGISPSRWYPVEGMKLKHPCVGLLQGAWIWGKTKELLTLTKVLEAMPNVTFYWVGDGPYREQITAVLGKYNNFKWLGRLDYPNKVREYLSEIDAYALISGLDMSPLTLQEAQLMNKPVLATNVGGIPELIKDGETGFLVHTGDYKDIIEKLTILINDTRVSKAMGIEGRKFVSDNFSWEIITRKFSTILKKIVENSV